MIRKIYKILYAFILSKNKIFLINQVCEAFTEKGYKGVSSYLSHRYKFKEFSGENGIDNPFPKYILQERRINIIYFEEHDKFISIYLQRLFKALNIDVSIYFKAVSNKGANIVINPKGAVFNKLTIIFFTKETKYSIGWHKYSYVWFANPNLIDAKLDTDLLRKIYLMPIDYSISDSIVVNNEYYFYRFMLAIGIILYPVFYNLVQGMVELGTQFICLSLPEFKYRRNAFPRNKKFIFFDGLRHEIGWVGCGLSYKFLMQLAKERELDSLVICEDDVEFSDDFLSNYLNVEKFLKTVNYDIFSGLIASLPEDFVVLSHKQINTHTYLIINKIMSTVFNVYNKSIFEHIANWDESNLDRFNNTIDKYISSKIELVTVVSIPFLVGHKLDCNSSVWGVSNSEYVEKINETIQVLKQRITSHQVVEL